MRRSSRGQHFFHRHQTFRRLAPGTRAGVARGILRVWPLWESIAHRLWPAIPARNTADSIMSFRPMVYRGQSIRLPDGTTIERGDRIAEVHLDNQRVVSTARKSYWRVQTVLREDLHAIAVWSQTPEGENLKAILGVTMLGVGGDRLGFTRRQLPPTLYNRLNRFYMSGLLALYSVEGLERLQRGTTSNGYPEEIWMSRATLLERYGGRYEET